MTTEPMIQLWVDEPGGKNGLLGTFAFIEIGEGSIDCFNPTTDDPDGPDPDVEVTLAFELDGNVRVVDHKRRYFDGQRFSRMTLLPTGTEDTEF